MNRTVTVHRVTRVVQAATGERSVVVQSGGVERSVISQASQGLAGPAFDGSTAFAVANRFSELADEQAKVEARTNLDLQYIDCGTFN